MSLSETELQDLLALHLVPGLGPRLTAALLQHFGSAAAVRCASAAQLQQVPHIGPQLAARLHQALAQVAAQVQKEWADLARYGVRLLARGSSEYPGILETIPDPPHLLYIRGQLAPADSRAVAIVGARQCTPYGRRQAERLAADLARAGWTVVSGLARGIDGAAHRGALAAGGRTLAVLAGGLADIYPPEHREPADQVAAAGALLTEAPLHRRPLAAMFPARNRLISGLAQAVVVVEAGRHSGALITAQHAAEQGRLVLAVPGPVDSDASAGAHELLRQGATLCRQAADVLEELQALAAPAAPKSSEPPPQPSPPPPRLAPLTPPTNLNPAEQRLWDLLAKGERSIDELIGLLERSAAEVNQLLFSLELKRLVHRLPGNRYMRAGP